MNSVLTVYLDQNKWIDLARAATGHPRGAEFVETLAVLKQAADDGIARFPLSCAHYLETGKQHDRTKRIELSRTMLRLAGQLRIAPSHTMVPWEIRRALISVFGLQRAVPKLELFGDGVAHAFSAPSLRYAAPAQWQDALPPEVLAALQARGEAEFEALVLGDDMPQGGPQIGNLRLRDHMNLTGDRFVRGQQTIAAWISEAGRHRLKEIMLATAFVDISEPLATAATELGITANQLADNVEDIIHAIPSRWTEMQLRHRRQANPQKAWEDNDLNDVISLSIAVPYCDVVVTERSWAAHTNAAKIADRFGTLVTPHLQAVVDRLAVT
ncbi:hypothetical protein FZI85_04055 [Mycobacterium sp. CBMA293]|nr:MULTISPECIES: hypothetical protein [unclassified Mycolicibacterium]MUL47109.1 hypothetical protein [Mycolicibacterium sp. CBMA 360]MUL58486.1 hypothetical protein [Mycolicibacterium sp. CBMA 335]MUL93369.1 hypothetical protein [Mycolicibacterium sp. CBMA 230]MUM10212.1 hypothetical protein [Mycolicibacterium sp. CBMA 293]